MVVFDANFLIYFLDPKLKDGAGNNPRVDHLVETIDQDRERIIVPTPALSELLVGAKDAAPQYLDTINRSRYFRIEPFGERAAVEAAAMTRDAIGRGSKLGPAIESSWAKVKFDRQIVAIASSRSQRHLFTGPRCRPSCQGSRNKGLAAGRPARSPNTSSDRDGTRSA
jgi:predicted nucleic acid-binding protein